MRKVVIKPYWDFEKEEKWLNEMSAKGFALVSYTICRYVFEPCKPGGYIYRLEMLKNLPGHPESAAYIQFMEESGAEAVSTYVRWVYFRKKASDGPFDIYSDLDSRISHYKRIAAFFGAFALLGLSVALMQLCAWHTSRHALYDFNLYTLWLILAVYSVIDYMTVHYLLKIRSLKKEKLLRE